MNVGAIERGRHALDEALATLGIEEAAVFHDGERWRQAEATMPVLAPATGEHAAEVADVGAEVAAEVAAGAGHAAEFLRLTAPEERAAACLALGQRLHEWAEPLATVLAVETGKPPAEALAEVAYARSYCSYYGRLAATDLGSAGQVPDGRARVVTRRLGIGPALLVTPWNLPVALAVRKLAAAIAAGCPCILKPSELTPLSGGLLLGRALSSTDSTAWLAVLPTSRPAELVDALLASGQIRKLSFTGSTGVGSALAERAARHGVPCSLELGGNAPALVMHDADVAAAADAIVRAKRRNAGQTCVAPNRVIVHSRLHDALVDELRARFEELRLSGPLDLEAGLGPVIDERARRRLDHWLAAAEEEGARVESFATRPERGTFVSPTLVCGLDPASELLEEEIFGPILPIIAASDDRAAIDQARSASGGLAAYVFCADSIRGAAIGERLNVGLVGVNRGIVSEASAPFGGVGSSGHGKEGGIEGLHAYQNTVSVLFDEPDLFGQAAEALDDSAEVAAVHA
ncbi:MAG: aldehyde dehydrogenase family protein [Actinobacteria bacterium]|nr:aldehyde dehydrogenase family protein [Actinomycetota bacterium]